jgi:hemerythrin-like metal-binding protein
MALMVWKDDYSVGNELLDGQHKRLIDLVNDVNGDADLGDVLAGLREYGEAHFKAEESLLEAANYPDLELHRQHHDAFRAWLAEVVAARRSGGDAAVARRDVYHYLSVWLANHLLVADKAFAPWLE